MSSGGVMDWGATGFSSWWFCARRVVVVVGMVMVVIRALVAEAAAASPSKIETPEVHVMIPSSLRRGDTAEIFCSLRRGSLPVSFRWLHNGKSIGHLLAEKASSSSLWKIDHRDRRSELLIEAIGAAHIGNYTCVASNDAGKTSYTASLLVDVPPSWIKAPLDGAVVVGSTVLLDCSAAGYPEPKAKWTRIRYPSESLIEARQGSRMSVLSNGTLSIGKVEAEDSGLYRCDVGNGIGSLLTKTVNLTVSVPPRIRTENKMIKVRIGHIVKLNCEASGEGPLQITWEKDGNSIEKSLKERYDIIERSFPGGITSDLLIHKSALTDSGEFKCLVSNKFGTQVGIRGLKVMELPSPPIGVKVDDIGRRSVRVSWKRPYSDVTSFFVRYWKDNGTGRKLFSTTASGSDTSVYLHDLQPGTEYSGHIVSQNDVGTSGPSVSMHFITSEEAPSAPPTDVHSTRIGEKELLVTWKGPPAEHLNGKIQGYYVGYKAHESALPYTFHTVTGAAESAVLKNLEAGTTYSIVVQAFNRAGPSPSSHQIAIRPMGSGLPSAPKFTTSDVTCCSVIITLISRLNPTEGITQYVVVYRSYNKPWKMVYFPPHLRKLQLRGLEKDTYYEVRVAAYSLQGRGLLSATAHFTTLRHGSPDDEEAVSTAEVPEYLRARVLVPVAVSLGIIIISVAAGFAYYRRMLATQSTSVKYETCVQRHGSWPGTSRDSFVRRSVAESSTYDTPWDAQAAALAAATTQAASIYDGNYTRLKGRGSNSHLALETAATSSDK
ncbi:cell adhesion molecule Dscam1-like [Ornithodoros turicata]|uniref:cell adhesion molecule Dscam1-like n=1 Tax=Ornithodoros turicata TaxID=34597 RepID=UPI00313A06E9